MTLDDLALLLDQSRLFAKAEAIARGRRDADPRELEVVIRDAFIRIGIWRGESDANLVGLYARGEMDLGEFGENFIGRI